MHKEKKENNIFVYKRIYGERYHKNKFDFVVIVVQKILTVDVVFASFYKPQLTVINRTVRQINSYSYRSTILKY